MRPYLGYLFIFLAAIFWGLLGVVGRFAMEGGTVAPLEAAFWRAAFASLFFAVHCLATTNYKVHSAKDLGVFALFGICSLGGFFACYQYAIKFGGAALSAVLLYTAPAWVALFAWRLFGIRLTLTKALAIGISLSGVAFISFSAAGTANGAAAVSSTSLAGIGFGLVAGFLYSTHYIFTKTYLSRYTPYTLYGVCMVFAALTLFPFVTFAEKNSTEWLSLLFIGLISTYGAYLAYCEGMKRLEPTRAAVLATLEPVIATGAAWWVWNESFAVTGWLGAALILMAVLLLVFEERKKALPEEQAAR